MSNKQTNNCCVCTSTKDLEPYMGTKFRCKVCEKEGRHPGTKK